MNKTPTSEAPDPFASHEELLSPEWQLAQRVAGNQSFARSAFLTNFLLYVCDRKLRGHDDEITEYQIGVHALGRRADYHPGDDNIVRNYARMLRKRLDEYFQQEGRHEPLRIVIPRGGYVPVFESNPAGINAPELKAEDTLGAEATLTPDPPLSLDSPLIAPPQEGHRPISLWIGALAMLLMLGISWAALRRMNTGATAYEQFWSQLFPQGRPALIVAGDSGFAMLQMLVGHEVHLNEYVTGNLNDQFARLPVGPLPNGAAFEADRFSNYISTADMHVIVGLSRLPQFQRSHAEVRYARDVRMDDLKQSSAILLGGPRANPWVELFELHSAFKMEAPVHLIGQHLDERVVVNKEPRTGELSRYSNLSGSEPHKTYTILSFLPALDGNGWALILQGQNMAGTEAAGDFALDSRSISPILNQALRPDGTIGPFELLLETSTIGADAPTAHIVLERIGTSD